MEGVCICMCAHAHAHTHTHTHTHTCTARPSDYPSSMASSNPDTDNSHNRSKGHKKGMLDRMGSFGKLLARAGRCVCMYVCV